MEVKDDLISKLNEEMVKKESQLRNEVEKVKRSIGVEFAEYKKESTATVEDLRARLTAAENELNILDAYRANKARHDEDFARMQQGLAEQATYTKNALDEQERYSCIIDWINGDCVFTVIFVNRKNLEAKSVMLKDMEDQKSAFRNIALSEARQAMSVESKKIVVENIRLHEELKFHHAMAIELQAEKSAAEVKLKTLQREMEVRNDKDTEYARQSYVKSKEIKILRDRVDQLEKGAVLNTEKFKMRSKELKQAVHKDLEEATLDAAGLRRLMKIKNKELRIMKSLAATILSQRSEMEQFFLEALSEVKEKIKQEKKKTKVETTKRFHSLKNTGNDGTSPRRGPDGEAKLGGTFPNIHPSRLHHLDERGQSEFPLQPDVKVNIGDLSWEDKELVLRVLFAKLNGLKSTVDNALMQPGQKQRGNDALAPSYRQGEQIPAVFISEGADEDGDMLFSNNYQADMEVRKKLKEVRADEEEFHFEDDISGLDSLLKEDKVYVDDSRNNHLYKHGYRSTHKLVSDSNVDQS